MANEFKDPFANEEEIEYDVDLTDVSSNFDVADDTYEAYIVDLEHGPSSKGNPMSTWTWRLTGYRKADNFQKVDSDAKDKEFKNFTATTKQALWKLAETTEAIGLGGAGSSVKFKKSDVYGILADLVIKKSEYEGKMRSSIDAVIPHHSGTGKKVQPAGVPS